MIDIVPVNVHHAFSESSKSVYPIAIANCKENRWALIKLWCLIYLNLVIKIRALHGHLALQYFVQFAFKCSSE